MIGGSVNTACSETGVREQYDRTPPPYSPKTPTLMNASTFTWLFFTFFGWWDCLTTGLAAQKQANHLPIGKQITSPLIFGCDAIWQGRRCGLTGQWLLTKRPLLMLTFSQTKWLNDCNYSGVMLNGVKHPFEVYIVRDLSLSSSQTLGQIRASEILRFTQNDGSGRFANYQANSKLPV